MPREETGEFEITRPVPRVSESCRDRVADDVPIRRVSDVRVAQPVDTASPSTDDMSISLDQARKAKALALSTFQKLADVAGVGVTLIGNEYGLKVNLSQPPAKGVELPSRVAGVPVHVEIVGPIAARAR